MFWADATNVFGPHPEILSALPRVVKKHSRDIRAVRIGSYMADPTSLSATTVGSNLILIRRNGTSDFC